jgi:rod shape determining protein RodA
MREDTRVIANIDWLTVILYLVLALIGWFNIYAAVYDESHSSIFDISQRYGKQLVWISLALVLAFVVLLIDAKFFVAFAYPIYLLVIISLVLVLIFGTTIAGSKSWFQLGGFAIQPAEFAKFSTALALAAYLGQKNMDMSKLKTKLFCFIIIGIPVIFIMLQYDTGTALVFMAFILVLFREGLTGYVLVAGFAAIVLFVSTLYTDQVYVLPVLGLLFLISLFFVRRNVKQIVRVFSVFLISGLFVFSVDYVFDNVLEHHQKARINVLLGNEVDLKGAGYNLHQSKIAIGSGGFAGKGYLKGTQTKFNFVPEQSTDFIFCTIGEEWGFIGSGIIISLYMLLFVRIVILAERQRSAFSRIYGYGVVSILFFHFAVNIGMTIGLAPVIGIPLPMLSYGGSSLWAFTLMLFVFIRQDANRLSIL